MSDPYAEEAFDAPPPASPPRAPARGSPRASSARRKFAGLGAGIELPEAALHPHAANTDAAGEARDENSHIITRSKRGEVAIVERNAAPTAAQMALRDFSAYHVPLVPTWEKAYLNELAYAETR